ncbi:MAG: hypothetical protein AMXMBFR25_22200 [Lysobacterales bacterium]
MRVALITGASGQVARALAQRLRGEGWRLVLVSRDVSRLDPGERDLLVQSDVSTPGGAEAALALAAEHCGCTPDALVHCAGNPAVVPFGRVTAEAFRTCIAAAVDTAFFSVQVYVRSLLQARRAGSIVLFGSAPATAAGARHAALAVAGGAIAALVRAVAVEYSAQGIRINAVAPDSVPAGDVVRAAEGAAVAAWLLGHDARSLNGEVIQLGRPATPAPVVGAGA